MSGVGAVLTPAYTPASHTEQLWSLCVLYAAQSVAKYTFAREAREATRRTARGRCNHGAKWCHCAAGGTVESSVPRTVTCHGDQIQRKCLRLSCARGYCAGQLHPRSSWLVRGPAAPVEHGGLTCGVQGEIARHGRRPNSNSPLEPADAARSCLFPCRHCLDLPATIACLMYSPRIARAVRCVVICLFAAGRALRLAWWLCPCLFRRCKIARLPLLCFWCHWCWTPALAEPVCANSCLLPAGEASICRVVASPLMSFFLWVMAHASSAHVVSWCPALYAADPRADASEQCQSERNPSQNVHVWQSVRGEQCAVTQRLEESVCQPPFRVPMRRP